LPPAAKAPGPPAPDLPPPAAKAPDPPIYVGSATALWEAYRDNVAAADAKYLNRTVDLIATGEIRKTGDGRYYIACIAYSAGGPLHPLDRRPHTIGPDRPYVYCYLNKDGVAVVSQANPDAGRRFQVRGSCRGRSESALALGGYFVTVEDCTAKPVTPPSK
jgi:hypothetical protein